MIPDPTNRAAWLAHFRQGFAGRPGVNPGQPFQPGAITGGAKGPTIVASTPDALQDALDMPGPAWVVVDAVEWTLREDIVIRADNKTLVGGSRFGLTLQDRGIRIDRAMNVAVANVRVQDARRDAFEVSQSRVVALAYCSAAAWGDGGIDIVRGSTDVAVIRCTITHGVKGMLIGASDTPVSNQMSGRHAHLGLLDDRQTRVSLHGCGISFVQVRAPLVRHGLVTLEDHWIIGGGKHGLIEARTGARVVWLSGGVARSQGRPIQAATDRGQSAKVGGHLYVAPGVDLDGATVQASWAPTAAELLAMGVGNG